MDQKKTNCPVLGRNVKDEPPLTQRVIGVKVHGICRLVFVCDETVRGGANLIIDILRRTLLYLEERNHLPCCNPVLYLQIDNCGENKNKTLIAFLTDLVRKKVFYKIKACFLMVGHTHDDIDQVFATISTHLRQIHVFCPDRESLFKAIRDAFIKAEEKPQIIPLAATEIFDYTAFYKHFIDKSISHHQMPHQFRIKTFKTSHTDGQEVVLVHYKNWAESQHWLPRYDCHDDPKTPEKGPVKGQMTRGQRADKVRNSVSQNSKKLRSAEDVPENDGYQTETEDLQDLQLAEVEVSAPSLITTL
jgi:hypothetical protein